MSDEGAFESLDRLVAKALASHDQEMQKIRERYLALSPGDRTAFRRIVETLLETLRVSEDQPSYLLMNVAVRLTIDNTTFDEDGNAVYEGSASVTCLRMLEAIQAWDAAKEFCPDSIL